MWSGRVPEASRSECNCCRDGRSHFREVRSESGYGPGGIAEESVTVGTTLDVKLPVCVSLDAGADNR